MMDVVYFVIGAAFGVVVCAVTFSFALKKARQEAVTCQEEIETNDHANWWKTGGKPSWETDDDDEDDGEFACWR